MRRRPAVCGFLLLSAVLSSDLPDLTPVEVECSSGVTTVTPGEAAPDRIMGTGRLGAARLAEYLLENNPDADPWEVSRLAALYVEEAAAEGVNADVAFAQMCLETGFLRFGGLVSPEQNNFCGLGATGPGEPGLRFPDARTGVRAHVQHLKAYASTEDLNLESVDPRFGYVSPRGRAPSIQGLAGTWAADPLYGVKLTGILEDLYR